MGILPHRVMRAKSNAEISHYENEVFPSEEWPLRGALISQALRGEKTRPTQAGRAKTHSRPIRAATVGEEDLGHHSGSLRGQVKARAAMRVWPLAILDAAPSGVIAKALNRDAPASGTLNLGPPLGGYTAAHAPGVGGCLRGPDSPRECGWTFKAGDSVVKGFHGVTRYHVSDVNAMRSCYRRIANVVPIPATLPSVMTLADRLLKARKDSGLTQAQVAALAGVKQTTIANIENGLRKKPREVVAIAAAVGVSPDWLASGAGQSQAKAQATQASPPRAGFFTPADLPIGKKHFKRVDSQAPRT